MTLVAKFMTGLWLTIQESARKRHYSRNANAIAIRRNTRSERRQRMRRIKTKIKMLTAKISNKSIPRRQDMSLKESNKRKINLR